MTELLLCMKKKSQFFDSLMDKRLSFPLKRCVFESSSISFLFFNLSNLLVYSSLFLILCTQGYIFLNLAYFYSTNTHVEAWIISISRNVITLCTLGEFNSFVVNCWLFFQINFFFKSIFQENYQIVKWSVSRSGPTFCQYWSGNNLFAKVISRQQKSPLTRKEWGVLGNN